MSTTLTKNQVKTFRADYVNEQGEPETIIAVVRHDDRCGNGHNTFSVTATIYGPHRHHGEPTCKHESGRTLWAFAGGCCHDEIAKRLPELRKYIKWHLVSTDAPMHYGANTVYHATEHGPTHAWVYYTGESDPLHIGESKERLIGYEKADKARLAEGKPGYRVEWDQKTAKVRNLEHARSSAVWPEATDDELTSPGLEQRLQERLPALMEEFRRDVEELGFTY